MAAQAAPPPAPEWGKLRPIRVAAKINHKSREYVRALVEEGEVTAYRKGGSDEAPRLWVDPAEVERAIMRRSVYVPKAMRQASHADRRPVRRRRGGASSPRLHPDAAAMLASSSPSRR